VERVRLAEKSRYSYVLYLVYVVVVSSSFLAGQREKFSEEKEKRGTDTRRVIEKGVNVIRFHQEGTVPFVKFLAVPGLSRT